MGFLINAIKEKIMLELQRNYITMTLPAVLEVPLICLEESLYSQNLEQIEVDKPIFIIGCHRSGTSIVYDTMAQHPDLAYFTNASALLPNLPILIHQIGASMGLDQVNQERFFKDGVDYTATTPCEGIRIWERYAPPDAEEHYLDETYNSLDMERYLNLIIKKHLKYFKRKRFFNKNPDNSVRIRYIKKLFPDAYFINIIRDGRAVCYSLLKGRQRAVEFFGADHPHAKLAPKVKGWNTLHKQFDQDPITLLGTVWKEVVETVEHDRQYINPECFLEIRFEDFVTQPFSYYEKVMSFCQLDWSDPVKAIFQKEANKIKRDRNESWKKGLTAEDLDRLTGVIGSTMKAYGYEI
jgi:omega-hydroxy-beta-dihydromenaquinone-9 sulfotransferase